LRIRRELICLAAAVSLCLISCSSSKKCLPVALTVDPKIDEFSDENLRRRTSAAAKKYWEELAKTPPLSLEEKYERFYEIKRKYISPKGTGSWHRPIGLSYEDQAIYDEFIKAEAVRTGTNPEEVANSFQIGLDKLVAELQSNLAPDQPEVNPEEPKPEPKPEANPTPIPEPIARLL
jgi:hypothetical protein